MELGSRKIPSKKLERPNTAFYDRTVRTDSFKQYLEKAQILTDQIPGEIESGLNSFRTIPDRLLEPNQDMVQAVLEDINDQEGSEILDLVWDYFTSSLKACTLCGILLESIHQAKRDCESLEKVVAGLFEEGNYEQGAVMRLYDLAESQKPFREPASNQFEAVRDCYCSLGNKLTEKKRVIEKRMNWVKYYRGGIITIVFAVVAGATSIAVVTATHCVAGLAVAPVAVAIMPNKKKNCYDFRRLRMGLLKKQKGQLEALCRGVYLMKTMLETITLLVDRLHNDLESNKSLVRLGWMHKEQLLSVQEVAQQLTKNHSHLIRQLSELDEQVYLFGFFINKSRKAVFREFSPF